MYVKKTTIAFLLSFLSPPVPLHYNARSTSPKARNTTRCYVGVFSRYGKAFFSYIDEVLHTIAVLAAQISFRRRAYGVAVGRTEISWSIGLSGRKGYKVLLQLNCSSSFYMEATKRYYEAVLRSKAFMLWTRPGRCGPREHKQE